LNVRSLELKLDDVFEVRRDHSLDVLLLTETWHDADSVCINRLRSEGFTVVERARCRSSESAPLAVNHGGVVVTGVSGVRLAAVDTGIQSVTFESVCVRVKSASSSCIVLLIYRPGSVAVSAEFFQELSKTLDKLATMCPALIIAGDLNVRLDRPSDPASSQLTDLLSARGLSCRVHEPTHELGGLLDVVATRDDLPIPTVQVIDVGLSDHHMLCWSMPMDRPAPVYTSSVHRPWRKVNIDELRSAIRTSRLCGTDEELDAELLKLVTDRRTNRRNWRGIYAL